MEGCIKPEMHIMLKRKETKMRQTFLQCLSQPDRKPIELFLPVRTTRLQCRVGPLQKLGDLLVDF